MQRQASLEEATDQHTRCLQEMHFKYTNPGRREGGAVKAGTSTPGRRHSRGIAIRVRQQTPTPVRGMLKRQFGAL